ncbi:Hypothetical protein A7982_06334 [Minicystis rosea]|nr:Hypothetical protein A7982_06334 [Minicystis rosea]
MPEYRPGDVAEDLAPGIYEGLADAFCSACAARWVEDEKRVHLACLADDIEAGRIVARRATWRHGALDGRPELGLVVTLLDPNPLHGGDVRALGDARERLGWPTFAARLSTANIALWEGNVRVFPQDMTGGTAPGRWWERHANAVNERLLALGWPGGQDEFVAVDVRVGDDHRVQLAR